MLQKQFHVDYRKKLPHSHVKVILWVKLFIQKIHMDCWKFTGTRKIIISRTGLACLPVKLYPTDTSRHVMGNCNRLSVACTRHMVLKAQKTDMGEGRELDVSLKKSSLISHSTMLGPGKNIRIYKRISFCFYPWLTLELKPKLSKQHCRKHSHRSLYFSTVVPEPTLLVSQGLVKNRGLGEKVIGKEYPGLILNLLGVKPMRLVF